MIKARAWKWSILVSLAAIGVCSCLWAAFPQWARYRDANLRDANGYKVSIRKFEAGKPRPVITFLEPSGPARCKVGEKIKVVIHCELPEGSDPPSLILASLLIGKLSCEECVLTLAPAAGDGYDGEGQFDGPKQKGEYMIRVQSFDYVKMPDSDKTKSVATCEIATTLQVKAK
jgi:hypothetical protein